MNGLGASPWWMAAGVLAVLFGLVLLGNGLVVGALLALAGIAMSVGALIARAGRIRRERHEELMDALNRR